MAKLPVTKARAPKKAATTKMAGGYTKLLDELAYHIEHA